MQDTPGTPSTFIRGTKAEWPDLNKIASLITGTVVLQAQLNQQTTALTALASRVSSVQHDLQADVVRVKEPDDQTAALREIQHLQDASDVLLAATASLASSSALNGRISAILNDLQQSSTKYTDFIAARDLLITWRVRMATLKEDSKTDRFSMSIDTTSDFAFSRTKSTAVTLTRIDMMPGTTATSAETVLSVAAECTSPFTISAGAAFTTLAEREFGIQAVVKNADVSKTDTVNQFVAVTKSSFHPLPIGLVNVRLWEPSEWFSLHASFGIAGNLKSQSAGGSDADFLMGPSISFFRTMFLTGGLHLGREVALGANYKLGDQVPSSVTTPPLQKSYKAAFGFAITFTKP